MDWLQANESDRWVRNAIAKVEGLYQRGGAHVEAFRLRGLSPRERAHKAWARLRRYEVDPRMVVAAWLAIEMVSKDNPQAETKKEYKQVQGAKIVHRLASGTHKRWQSGSKTTEMHVYPASRGQVLRYVGEDLEKAVETLAEYSLKDLLLSFKAARKSSAVRPHGPSTTGRRRKQE